MGNHKSYGPIFGGKSSDICIENNSNLNARSYTDFPDTYADTTGFKNNTFTGNKFFTTKEVEVFEMY